MCSASNSHPSRHRLFTLRAAIPPTRTALLTTLSSIYPIELLSPPDLLYTILDAPLPIPLSSSDPAPPLHLPSHSSVTEEAVAAALGFAAQLLQLLAAYLRKGLVYPVTCVGSRSFVRDDISAMVGPRMLASLSSCWNASKGIRTGFLCLPRGSTCIDSSTQYSYSTRTSKWCVVHDPKDHRANIEC